jgi:hypothetical protein
MEIIILLSWSIWTSRNNFIIKNEAYSVDGAKGILKELPWLSIGPNQSTFQE